MNTQHATARAQQRSIPPLVDQWLDQFGEENYDGHGGVLRFFSCASIRAMERAFWSLVAQNMPDYPSRKKWLENMMPSFKL